MWGEGEGEREKEEGEREGRGRERGGGGERVPIKPISLLSQVMNIQVPFFFKYAVDYFNKLPPLTTPEGTIITVGTALVLGCVSVL